MPPSVEDVLDKKLRPLLREHNGNIALHSFTEGVLLVRMTGGCANCPAAAAEIEQFALESLKGSIPGLVKVQVVTGVSDELLEAARALLKKKHNGEKDGELERQL
jgi:Fe-S cluster biogenesis protein NfuA